MFSNKEHKIPGPGSYNLNAYNINSKMNTFISNFINQGRTIMLFD